MLRTETGVCVLLIDLAGDRRAVVSNSVAPDHVNGVLHNGCYGGAGGQSPVC